MVQYLKLSYGKNDISKNMSNLKNSQKPPKTGRLCSMSYSSTLANLVASNKCMEPWIRKVSRNKLKIVCFDFSTLS